MAQDYEEELRQVTDTSQNMQKEFELPDGGKVTLRHELVKVPEALFNPQVLDRSLSPDGLGSLTYDSVMRCDLD